MSFAQCPSCGKTVFLKDSQECPNCGVIVETGAAAQPQTSDDNSAAEFPRKSGMSCAVAGMAAAVAIIGAVIFVIMAARN